MKKIFTSIFVCLLCVFTTLSSVVAATYDTSKLEEAYNKIVAYYQSHKTLESPDEIIAVEALGLEAEDGYELPDLESQDFETLSLGDLTKSIIALTLIGKNPTDVNGTDLVTLLEGYVNEDGSVEGSYGSTTDIWVLSALECVSSKKVSLVANHLSNDNNIDGGFWYESGYESNGKKSSPDTTGWGIEALTIAGKDQYSESINKALNYLETQKSENAIYGEYGANPDTQACVLQGLFVYDSDKVVKGTYNDQEGNNPIDVLLDFQLEDGSFKAAVYDSVTWLPTGEYAFNSYTTLEAARCLGTYKNGSFIYKAQKTYEETINPAPQPEPEPEEKPTIQPAPSVEENKEPEQKPTETLTSQPTKTVVQTADNTDITVILSVMIISGGIFFSLRKKYENIH